MELLIALIYIYLAADWLLMDRFWLWEFASVIPWYIETLIWIFGVWLALIIGQPFLALGLFIFFPRIYQIRDFGLGISHLSSVADTIKLFNWNTEYWTQEHEIFYEFLRAQDADIYHLQEAWVDGTDDLPVPREVTREVFEGLGDEYYVIQHEELVTATKFPVEHIVREPENNFLRLDLKIQDKVISFYNVHIPVHIRPSLLSNPRVLLDDAKQRFELRKKRTALLLAELETNPNPKVISGDFNTQTSQPLIYKFFDKFKDAYRQLNAGIPVSIKLYGLRAWRIDYVFLDRVRPIRYKEVDPEGMSDHSGIAVKLRV